MSAITKKFIGDGRGQHNKTLMMNIKKELCQNNKMRLISIDDCNFNNQPLMGDYIEAQAFGFLAVRHFYGLPLTCPKQQASPNPSQVASLFIQNSKAHLKRS